MSDIEKLKTAVNIVDIVSKYVDLKSAGSNYKGVCPFHNEKTPSFMVNPSLQIFKCFGCGKAGDVINFVQEIERLDFGDALQKIADLSGIELPKGNYHKDEKLEKLKKRIIEMNTITAKYFHHLLKSHKAGEKARKYAAKRKIGAKEIQKFMFGYAPTGYENLKKFMISRNFTEEELLEGGLLVDRKGRSIDKFRDRLMQPIHNLNGEIIGFSGRYLGDFDGAPKYLNSSESPVYKKNEILYGLYFAKDSLRKDKNIILVEGNIDVVSSHRVGVENIAAPLGTAFTSHQAKLLKRFVDEVLLSFDTDTAGLNATIRAIGILEEAGIAHKVIDLGDYQDSDELICTDPNLWKEKVSDAKDTFDFLKIKLSNDLDLGTADGKTHFRDRIIPILSTIKDNVKKNHYIQEAALLLDVSRDEIQNMIETKPQRLPIHDEVDSDEDVHVEEEKDNSLENYFLALLIQKELPTEEYSSDLFLDDLNKEVFMCVKEGKDPNKSDSRVLEKYKKLFMRNLQEVEDSITEAVTIYKRLKKESLKNKILNLRKKISINADDQEALEMLNKLSRELKSV